MTKKEKEIIERAKDINAANLMHIASVIKKNRKRKNITQTELAIQIGTTGSTVSRYERGLFEIPAAVLKTISEQCAFNPMQYFDFDDSEEGIEKILKRIAQKKNKESDTVIPCIREDIESVLVVPYHEFHEELSHIEWMVDNINSKRIPVEMCIVDKCLDNVIDKYLIEMQPQDTDIRKVEMQKRLLAYYKRIAGLKDS